MDFLADQAGSTNTSGTDSFIQSWFVKISLRHRYALMVADGAFSHKIDYVTNASKSHYWFKNYGDFAERVDFAYLWSFIMKPAKKASASAEALRRS